MRFLAWVFWPGGRPGGGRESRALPRLPEGRTQPLPSWPGEGDAAVPSAKRSLNSLLVFFFKGCFDKVRVLRNWGGTDEGLSSHVLGVNYTSLPDQTKHFPHAGLQKIIQSLSHKVWGSVNPCNLSMSIVVQVFVFALPVSSAGSQDRF